MVFGRKQADHTRGSHTGSPVVVGLGNPGRSYSRTRHNAGFLTADELANRHGRGTWRKKKKAESASISLRAKEIELIKPTTYMNNSGAALSGRKAEGLIVIHDDLDLDPGAVRVKIGGGAGGHNGLKSLIQHVGPDFVRVRVGIGRPPEGVGVTPYVLGKMEGSVAEAAPTAADAVEEILESGAEAAMNRFNVKT
ncbi:aminoacyl-tRNA hydrolase [Rubrobacter aplysinae]|uniref:aminoacyl-tRNA hydrolase n=1 Tax=Rubrobacter aplysinae TaxID=909625 RepID=UPI00064C152A|nr:aminoacyl-tRNA hydrolase [Rubrobacter aplysinae]